MIVELIINVALFIVLAILAWKGVNLIRTVLKGQPYDDFVGTDYDEPESGG